MTGATFGATCGAGATSTRLTVNDTGAEDALVHWCTMKGLEARPLGMVGYGDEDEGADAAPAESEA